MKLPRRRRVAAIDLLREAISALIERPGRSLLTATGTILGISALVSILGLTTSAQAQVSSIFNVFDATQVTVQDGGGPGEVLSAVSANTVRKLNGVESAGLLRTVETKVAVLPETFGGQTSYFDSGIYAATPDLFETLGAHWQDGAAYDLFAEERAENEVVLGSAIAGQLGVSRSGPTSAVYLNGVPFYVTGIMSGVNGRADLLTGIIVPTSTADRVFGAQGTSELIIRTEPGAAALIGRQAPVALLPTDPQRFVVQVPPDAQGLRQQVNASLQVLLLSLAGICLLIGMVSIANTTLVSVLERVPEIGLRRANGARRGDIARHFMLESVVLGLFGGTCGSAIGMVVISSVCFAQSWTAVVDSRLVVAAPVLGMAVGLLAGLYPAVRAARYTPAEALRR